MKTLVMAFLIIGMRTGMGYSECVYFRVSAKLLTCAPADAKTLANRDPYPAAPEVPEFDDSSHQALIQVNCDCAYSLQGSDPRCDVDQAIERSSVLGADDPAHSCHRGNALCRDVCPPHLP
jgi:hypothetical protein